MSTERSRSTSATGPSGCNASSSAGRPTQAGFSTSAGPFGNALPNHVHNQRQLIESLALAIAKEKKEIPLPGTMGTPVFGGADITKPIKAYESISSRTVTDLAADDDIAMFPYYCSETIQETIKMMNGYLRKDWMQLKEELKDAIRHANSRVHMYTRLYSERWGRDQLKRGNLGLKAFIRAYDNISCILINKGALAEYSLVELLLDALPRDLRTKAVMILEQDPRDPTTF